MRRHHLVCVLAIAGLAACGNSGGGAASPPKQARPPSEKCGAAAETLARFDNPAAPADELAPLALPLKRECEQLLLSDDEAQCLADAVDKLAALKCPRALGAELREVETVIGTGPCRPVLLVTHLAEIAQLRQMPDEQRGMAIETFKVVKRVLGDSCRKGNWGAEAMECFATRDVMHAFGCIESVPPEILQKVDSEIKRQMMAQVEQDGPVVGATGVPACDDYLRTRQAFDKCEAAPPSLKQTLLAIVAPLEKPWRSLPDGALASTGETFTAMCEQASGQLRQLATSVGCL